MIFSIRYKSPNGLFWHKVKNIEAWIILKDDNKETKPTYKPLPALMFFLENKRRVIVPLTYIIEFMDI